MSCHQVITKDGAKVMRPVTSEKEYRTLRHTLRQMQLVRMARRGTTLKYEDGTEHPAKSRLVQMNYSCLPADDAGHLKGSTRLSRSVGMDIDLRLKDFADAEAFAKRLDEVRQTVLDHKDQLGLLMLERSASQGEKAGYHLVFRRRAELSQEENLRWASQLLGVPFDDGAKDITRVFFTTTASEDDLLFLSEDLFNNEEMDKGLEFRVESSQTGKKQRSCNGQCSMVNVQSTYHGFPYADIIRKYWELYNGGKEPAEGERNSKTYELALMLASICNFKAEVLEAVIPRYDNFPEEEWRTTLANALKDASRQVPLRITQVLRALRAQAQQNALGGVTDVCGNPLPPELPERLPAVLQLLCSRVSPHLRSMVTESVWPAMCAHLQGVTFCYTDGVLHEANICSPLIGRQSTGKGFVNQPIEHLLADITARDRANEDRLYEWRRRNQGKGATKDRQPRPDDISIQRLDDDLTAAALAQSLIDAERNGGRRIITKVDEIEMLNKVTNGRNPDVGLLVRYGFDSARWGQRRVGVDSVNGSYVVRWVWNASCTPKSARKFITANWVADGSLSRLNLNALMLPADQREQPVSQPYDGSFDAELKPYVDRLNAASGLITCEEAQQMARRLQQEHSRVADLCDSEGYRVFSYRAVVIGWLKAMMLYLMNGYGWDSVIEEYVSWSVQRDMWLKMHFFGEQIEAEFRDEENTVGHGPSNLLGPLPPEFTFEEYVQLRQQQGRTGNPHNALRVWKHRGLIEYDELTKRWVKTSKATGL